MRSPPSTYAGNPTFPPGSRCSPAGLSQVTEDTGYKLWVHILCLDTTGLHQEDQKDYVFGLATTSMTRPHTHTQCISLYIQQLSSAALSRWIPTSQVILNYFKMRERGQQGMMRKHESRQAAKTHEDRKVTIPSVLSVIRQGIVHFQAPGLAFPGQTIGLPNYLTHLEIPN